MDRDRHNLSINESFDFSFEDIETTLTSPRNILGTLDINIIQPASSTSSENTTFSRTNDRYSVHTETSDGNYDDFINDFEELKIGNNWKLRKHDNFEPKELKNENVLLNMQKKMTSGNRKSTKVVNQSPSITSIKRTLKQPKSMMNLRLHQLPSVSKEITKNNTLSDNKSFIEIDDYPIHDKKEFKSLRNKVSMPTLSSYKNDLIPKEKQDDRIYENEELDDYDLINDFKDGFKLNEKLLKSHLIINSNSDDVFYKLSPSHYTVMKDDTLLTPHLHKRNLYGKDTNLDSFKERAYYNGNVKDMKKTMTVSQRLKTIKQEIDYNTPVKMGKMYYNPTLLVWEGNEDALDKFKSLDGLDKKALLITSKLKKSCKGDSKVLHGKIVGKMMFDEKNLRWVNINGEEKDPFGGIDDFAPQMHNILGGSNLLNNHKTIKRSQSQGFSQIQGLTDKLCSNSTLQYHSLEHPYTADGNIFIISSKQIEKFYREENKWNKKVGSWFINSNNDPKIVENKSYPYMNKDYMYEIRNMVISSSRN